MIIFLATQYAIKILKGCFELGEEAIYRDSDTSYLYEKMLNERERNNVI